jgi:hypothetical protein
MRLVTTTCGEHLWLRQVLAIAHDPRAPVIPAAAGGPESDQNPTLPSGELPESDRLSRMSTTPESTPASAAEESC